MTPGSDMDSIAQKQVQRTRLLLAVYERTDGRVSADVNMYEVGEALGLTKDQTRGVVEHLVDTENLLEGRYMSGGIGLTPEGVAAAEAQLTANTVSADRESESILMPDPKKVFVVHGRDEALRRSIFAFLRAVNLEPIEWSQAVRLTGKGAPYIGEVLDAAFESAQAVLVLLTPDDEVRLIPDLCSPEEPADERELRCQPRPNVLFEAGMAFGRNPDRTVLVEVGSVKPFSDVAGRHTIRLTNDPKQRNEVANRLATAGCAIDTTGGTDWLSEGDFSINRPSAPASVPDAQASLEAVKYVDQNYPSDSGLQGRLEEQGFSVNWVCDDRLARAIDIDGWRLVSVPEGDKNVVLKLHDRPIDHTLVMKRR